MRYWERYLLCALFMIALPHIIYETIKYYNPKYDKLWDWFVLNLDYNWEELKQKGLE